MTTTSKIKAGKNKYEYDRVPPHDLEAEQSLLGSMLISSEAVSDVVEIARSDDFYNTANKCIFEAIVSLFSRGEPVDPIIISEELTKNGSLEKAGGKPYIHTLVNIVPTSANAKHYAEIVRNKAILRNLINAAYEIAQLGYEIPDDIETAIDKAEQLIFSIAKDNRKEKFVHIKPTLVENFELLEKLYEKKAAATGIPTGFYELDKKTSGLHASDLIVVAARPSMGKTSLVLSVAKHIAIKEKTPVAIFSLEMSRHQLVQRLMCSEARVDAQNLRTGHLKEEDWGKLSNAVGKLAEAPIYIDDSPSITVMELRAKARRLKAKNDIGLIIVDYLQLMSSDRRFEQRQQEISEISRALKNLGRELSVPVIAVSQLSRAVEQRHRDDKRPMLSDLRDSGAIEQDADLVIFIYRDEYYNKESEDKGIAEVIIGKHRNGPVGTVKLVFLEHYATFANLMRKKE